MKVFSKEKFIEDMRKEGKLDNFAGQFALDTWVRRIDGQKVVNGMIRRILHRK